MRQYYLLIFLAFLVVPRIYSQSNSLLQANTIPLELKIKANAVIRYNNMQIIIKDYNKITLVNTRIVTVLNKYGKSKVGAIERYDDNRIIKKMEVRIFDAHGSELKKIKKKDFNDESFVPNGTLYSDRRIKYLDYIPIDYPYTVLYEVEMEYNTTAFLPQWLPVEGLYVSTENSEFKVVNASSVVLKIKKSNFEGYNIEELSEYYFKATNVEAIGYESYSPPFSTYAPKVKIALTEFDMEGVRGTNTNWEDFGKWVNNSLINGTESLPNSVKDEIKSLTANAITDIEKAKIVYEYMQEKTRYISVQVGVGGWKPMLAEDVDRLGYGDCKALSNYTKSLLDEVGVQSYYTLIYGGKEIRDFDEDFSVTEGNHAILCIPIEDDYIWLECTSQTNPFSHIASFTDDRDALIITPEGGKIVHTRAYSAQENLLKTSAQITLDEKGGIIANVTLETSGTQYSKHRRILRESHREQDLYYKDFWSYINNLNINSKDINDDKEDIVLTETISVEAKKYASKAGNRILLQPNVFNRVTSAPPRYEIRKLPFEIDRGFLDIDEFTITIPEIFEVEALQETVSIENQFGAYEYSIQETSKNVLTFKRKFLLKKGTYNKEDYIKFRAFWLTIIKHDKSKIALKLKA